jgi:hypothetical protein
MNFLVKSIFAAVWALLSFLEQNSEAFCKQWNNMLDIKAIGQN